MKLVPDWKDAWKWHSTQLVTLAIALPGVWATLPPDLIASIPDVWVDRIQVGLLVCALIGRVRDQGISNV